MVMRVMPIDTVYAHNYNMLCIVGLHKSGLGEGNTWEDIILMQCITWLGKNQCYWLMNDMAILSRQITVNTY